MPRLTVSGLQDIPQRHISMELVRKTQRVVAGYANDADDARELLDMLGLLTYDIEMRD